MADDPGYIAMVTIALVLGAAGLVAIPMLPLRAWTLLRDHRALLQDRPRGTLAWAVVAVAAGASLWLALPHVRMVLGCLLDSRCGPNVASAWLRLGLVGATWATFETIAAIALLLARRVPRRRT